MIVSTKINIPHIRTPIVPRAGLTLMLDEGMDAKLTLVSAPVGYGKTTLLSEWARQSAHLTAWVSLDKQDSEWATFWSYCIHAVRERIPEFGQSVLPLLESGPTASSVSSEPAISAMLNELNELNQSHQELAIVLDDYHHISDPAIRHSLIHLLEYLPPHVHLFIASRAALPIPTSRLLARGEMKQVTLPDMRFRPAEGFAFFRTAANLPLTKEQAFQLCFQTEGWISGLQLAAITLKRSSDIEASLRQFNGHQHHISTYLLEEVFQHIDKGLHDFMLKTSILERMNHSLCQAVTGETGSQARLEQIERLNLFLVPLDESKHWYRYHHLLAEFLQKQFADTASEEWMLAHLSAARWLERHGLEEQAAEHYLVGRQYDDAVRVIESQLPLLILKKSATLARWVLHVPVEHFAKRPLVEMFYWSHMVGTGRWQGVPEKVQQVRRRYELLKDETEETEWRETVGSIYIMCAVTSYIKRDLSAVETYFKLADQHLTEDSLFVRLGHNPYLGQDEFEDHLSYINDLPSAEDYLNRMLEYWKGRTNHPFADCMYASYSMLLYEWDRLEEAAEWIGLAVRADGTSSALVARNLLHLYIAASRIQQALGNPGQAAELLERLKQLIDSPDYDRFMRKIEAEQAWLLVRQGDLAHGARWLETCGMSHDDESTLNNVPEQLALVRVLAACGLGAEAMSLSERMYLLLHRENRLRDRIKIRVAQSMTLHRDGQTEQAFVRLEQALRLAQPEGYIRSFTDEGRSMAELLSSYMQVQSTTEFAARSDEIIEYAGGLLQSLHASLSPDEGSEAGSMEDDDVQVLAKVCCFGRFRVLAADGGETELKWRTSKARELMAYLVYHRGEPVDRHRMLDDIWGDADIERAGAQLNINMHYLRKNLRSLGLEDNIQYANGHYRIHMERIACDYDEFRRLLAAGIPDGYEDRRDYEVIVSGIYRTGYMNGSDYPWAEHRRGGLEQEYVRLLLDIQDRDIEENQYAAAVFLLKKALVCDPFNEGVHAKLIKAYVLSDDRGSAMKQYEQLRSMLREEFGTEPAEAVTRLLNFC